MVRGPLAPRSAAALRRRLLAWYDEHGRVLPWRERRSIYGTWIAEIMLQQTTVAVAAPYWERFLARFPDVTALAAASEPEVLASWAGLGYYRRARDLHAAARTIVARDGGRLSRQFPGLAGAARHRSLHGRGDRQHRRRRTGARGRRERAPGAPALAVRFVRRGGPRGATTTGRGGGGVRCPGSSRRLEPGADGPGRGAVPPRRPGLRRLPGVALVPRASRGRGGPRAGPAGAPPALPRATRPPGRAARGRVVAAPAGRAAADRSAVRNGRPPRRIPDAHAWSVGPALLSVVRRVPTGRRRRGIRTRRGGRLVGLAGRRGRARGALPAEGRRLPTRDHDVQPGGLRRLRRARGGGGAGVWPPDAVWWAPDEPPPPLSGLARKALRAVGRAPV